jgi:hypothetical protein
MTSVNNLPILGNISLPVHIMHYDNKEDKKKFFQSGFAFFAVADDQADVVDAKEENIGSLGSCMGGHYQVHAKREKESIYVIINVEDMWKQMNELFDSEDVQIKFEEMEKIYNEYWPKYQAAQETEKATKAKLKEIKQMQKDAEEEKIHKAEEKARKLQEKNKPEVNDNIEIIDNNGWNLDEELPSQDWMIDTKISSKLGCGIKTKFRNESYTYKHLKKPKVTLEITSWKGTSAVGAIHYYGKLHVGLPEMVNDENKRTCSISGFGGIPMFKNHNIELTQVLEAWEIEKYPGNYQYCKPGDHNRGFYSIAAVERKGKEIFEKIFEEGWDYKVERHC